VQPPKNELPHFFLLASAADADADDDGAIAVAPWPHHGRTNDKNKGVRQHANSVRIETPILLVERRWRWWWWGQFQFFFFIVKPWEDRQPIPNVQ
jgi:hypothetical protein